MGTFGKWLLGLIILALAALIFQFTPWGAKTNSVAMGKSVASALQVGGFKNITTDMLGNVAKLSGTVGSEKAKANLISTAQNAQCEKCGDREAGKRWHEVDGSNITVKKVVATVSPYTLTGVRMDDGSVVLNGYVSNKTDRRALLTEAQRLFPGSVTDRKIRIAQGAPNANWNSVAFANLAGLARLDSGEFSMTNWDSVLTGRTASADIRSQINGSISNLGGRYNGATNISVPDMAAANTGQIKSEDICQGLFDRLKGDNKISFASGRDEISGDATTSLLDALASAATQCSNFRITIEGHTDSSGNAANNLELSRRRAKAVLNYLVKNGVSAKNVSADGYGETRPIASNDTPAGMAANRRIEFKVTRSK